MKNQRGLVSVFVFLLLAQLGTSDKAPDCDSDSCNLPNCRCSSGNSPFGDNVDSYPQLIGLAFDEAVTESLYQNRWSPLLFNRTNPDGNNIGATFFVPHEYTNYARVNDLYNYGFEIGVHSISENTQVYWRTASEETLVKEFQGQKKILTKFANIPSEVIIGVRTPQLQLAGNNSIKAYISSELSYDNSWPSLPSTKLFPYTLDYASTESCLLGAECPTESFPGFWILPINDLQSPGGTECNNLASCDISGTADEISNWLYDQINSNELKKVKTPMTLSISSYWFDYTANSFEALNKFMDRISAERTDVYFVNQKQILDFIKNPVTTDQFDSSNTPAENRNCLEQTCNLKKDDEDRHMVSCVKCPSVYPWLDDPEGNGSFMNQ
jgi:hypothetical protein